MRWPAVAAWANDAPDAFRTGRKRPTAGIAPAGDREVSEDEHEQVIRAPSQTE